jgi:hypothetical protein
MKRPGAAESTGTVAVLLATPFLLRTTFAVPVAVLKTYLSWADIKHRREPPVDADLYSA